MENTKQSPNEVVLISVNHDPVLVTTRRGETFKLVVGIGLDPIPYVNSDAKEQIS